MPLLPTCPMRDPAGDTLRVPRPAISPAALRGPHRLLATPARRAAAALTSYLAGSVLLFLPAWVAPTTRWIGPSGDAQQAMWFLSWTPHAVAAGADPLTTTHLAAPVGVNLAWNTLMPLTGLLMAPVTRLAGPVAAYNLLITFGVALSAWCAFLAMRRLVSRDTAALAGGALYGFSPWMVAHAAGHPDLTTAVYPPLILLLLHRLLTPGGSALRIGVAAGLLTAAQLGVWEETVAVTAIGLVVALVVLAAQRPACARRLAPHVLSAAVCAAGVTVVVAAPLLAEQFLGALRIHGSIQQRGSFAVDLLNPIVPTATTLFAPQAAGFGGSILENGAYLGVPLLAVITWTAMLGRHEVRIRTAALVAATMTVLSLGPSLHVAGHDTGVPLPWREVSVVPLVGEILPARLSLVVDLCAAILLAMLMDRWRAPSRPRVRMLVLGAVGLALIPRVPIVTEAAVPAFFSGDVHRIPADSTVLVAPYSQSWQSSDPMLWQAVAEMRFRMPEGYFTGPAPQGGAIAGPPYTELSLDMEGIAAGDGEPPHDPVTRARLRDQLRRWQVGNVVAGPMEHRAAMVSFLSWVLGTAPAEDQGVAVWWSTKDSLGPA